jgi:uncharacterized protein HemY
MLPYTVDKQPYTSMKKTDYEREAEILAELASLAMKQKDYGKAEKYLTEAKQAIENARKALP